MTLGFRDLQITNEIMAKISPGSRDLLPSVHVLRPRDNISVAPWFVLRLLNEMQISSREPGTAAWATWGSRIRRAVHGTH